jgi:EmrB/QacA subfamily drug resistance transporter
LAVLCVSLLIVTLDNTVLNVVLPTLVRDLDATSSQLQWIVDAYALVFAGLLLVAGSLADRVGRKRTFLAGLAAFAGGSTWAAFSGSVPMLIAARASMGVGAALIMPSTLAIIADMFTESHQRQRAIGLWAGTSGLGIALGPIVGGLLLAHYWWGSVFLINVPIAAAGALFAVVLVPDSKNPAAKRPDVAGSLLSMAGLGLVLWSLIEAPVRGWSDGLVIGTGIGGLTVLAAFAGWQRISTHPMLNLEFFRDRSFSAAITLVGLVTFGLLGALFVLTQYLQFELGYTALEAGVRVLPAAGAIAVIAPLSSLLVRAVGTKLTVAAGLLVVAAGLVQISTASTASTFLDTLPGMILLGVGSGLVTPSATASVIGSLPRVHSGVGSATNGTFLQVGGALGVAVAGSLLVTRYQNRMTDSLAPYMHAPALPAGVTLPPGVRPTLPPEASDAILGSLGGALEVATRIGGTLGKQLAAMARSAFVTGMDLSLLVGADVAIAGGLLALLLLPSRNAPLTTNTADARPVAAWPPSTTASDRDPGK